MGNNNIDLSRISDPSYAPTLYPEKGKTLFPFIIVCISGMTLALILRFWSRATLNKQKFGWDDWTALMAWPVAVGFLVAIEVMLRNGFGLHITEVPLGSVHRFLKLLFAAFILYNQAITFIRISVLLFYYRVFRTTSKVFKYNIWAGIVANVAWVFAFLFVIIFQCSPVHSFWNRSVPGLKCISVFHTQLGAGITSILLDLWVLLTPMPSIWKLQMRLLRKLLIFAIFVIGYCTVVFTIGRTCSVFITGQPINTDVTWGFLTTVYWFVCEISVTFVAICLPSLFHLFRRAYKFGLSSLFNDHDDSLGMTSVPLGRQARRAKELESESHSREDDLRHLATAAPPFGGSGSSRKRLDQDLEMGEILRTQSLYVTEDTP